MAKAQRALHREARNESFARAAKHGGEEGRAEALRTVNFPKNDPLPPAHAKRWQSYILKEK